MAVRFVKVLDWDTETYFRSNKLNNSEFDYWLVGKLYYMDLLTGDFPHTYHIEIMAIAPSEVPFDVRDGALSSLGMDDEELDEIDNGNVEKLVMALAEAGIGAFLWKNNGNNKKELLKEMRQEAQLIETLFGFYMDRPENMIGSTGWDFIKGDVMAGLNRRMEKRNELLA